MALVTATPIEKRCKKCGGKMEIQSVQVSFIFPGTVKEREHCSACKYAGPWSQPHEEE